MELITVTFTVLGHPEPGGSKRGVPVPGGGVRVLDANRKVMPWRALVAAAAQEAMSEVTSGLLTGPVAVAFTFYRQRPAGHYGTGGNSDRVRPAAPLRPVSRPDVTKLVRAAEDALTGIVWRDDSQVVTQVARKEYGTPERLEVKIQCWTKG